MTTRRSVPALVAIAVLVGWTVNTVPARAGFVSEAPTSVGTLSVTYGAGPNPTETLGLGGAMLYDGSGAAFDGNSSESAFKFDLTSFSPGTQINSATFSLTVFLAQAAPDSPSLLVSGFASSNPTVTIPDFDVGSTPETDLGSSGTLPEMPFPLNDTVSFDATSYIQSLVNGGMANVGFISENGDSSVTLYGNDPSNPVSFVPTLTISFGSAVPEPSSLVLCGMAGMIGLAISRVRRARVA